MEDKLHPFILGSAVEKGDLATHHSNENFRYYSIPLDKFTWLTREMIIAGLKGQPWCLSEHAPKVTRLFLDLDCNKGETPTTFKDSDMDGLMTVLQGEVQRKFPVHPRFRSLQCVGSSSPFSWFLPPEVCSSTVPWYLALVFKSPSCCEYSTYHIVWPFVVADREEQRAFFTGVFTQFSGYAKMAKPDLGLYSTGFFRAPFNAKTIAEPQRALVLHQAFADDVSQISGETLKSWIVPPDMGVQEGQVHFLQAILTAGSVLFGRPGFEGNAPPPLPGPVPTPPASPGSPPSPDENEARRLFREGMDNFDPVHVAELVSSVIPTIPREMDYNSVRELLVSAVTPYYNRFCARILGSAKAVYLVRTVGQNLQPFFQRKDVLGTEDYFYGNSVLLIRAGNMRKAREIRIFQEYRKSPGILTFYKMDFGPPETVDPLNFNLWRGYDVSPEMAKEYANWTAVGARTGKTFSVQTVLDHIYSFMTDKTPEAFTYAIRWWAHLLQKPFEKMGTCLVFIGPEGTGKDMIWSRVNSVIMGHSAFFQTNNIEDVIGRFAPLEGKILVVMDEISGLDGDSSDKLKAVITEEMTRSEEKFQSVVSHRNYSNLILTSNSISPNILGRVTAQQRRFVTFHAGEAGINHDHDYFWDLYEDFFELGKAPGEPKRGVYALAHFLYTMDISGWNPKVIPNTKFMEYLKLSNMPLVHEWWYQCLLARCIIGHNDVDLQLSTPNPEWEADQLHILSQELIQAYLNWHAKKKTNKPALSFHGFYLQFGNIVRSAEGSRHKRKRERIVPKHAICVTQFQVFYPGVTFEEGEEITGLVTNFYHTAPSWSTAPSLGIPDQPMDLSRPSTAAAATAAFFGTSDDSPSTPASPPVWNDESALSLAYLI